MGWTRCFSDAPGSRPLPLYPGLKLCWESLWFPAAQLLCGSSIREIFLPIHTDSIFFLHGRVGPVRVERLAFGYAAFPLVGGRFRCRAESHSIGIRSDGAS